MNIIGDVALFTHGTINGNRTRKGTSREKGDGAREMIKIEEKCDETRKERRQNRKLEPTRNKEKGCSMIKMIVRRHTKENRNGHELNSDASTSEKKQPVPKRR